MKDFAGRTAFVTGGANGVGLGIVRNLLNEGCKVAIADIRQDAIERTLATLDNREVMGVELRKAEHLHGGEHDVFDRVQVLEQLEILEDHADFGTQQMRVIQILRDVLAFEADRALVRRLKKVKAAQQRRFARARRADEDDRLAFVNREGAILQHMQRAEMLVDADDV